MTMAIEIQELRKRYGDREVLHGLSLRVAPGEVVGLLGPNGAGKTTTLECAEGLRRPDGGTIAVDGIDPQHGARGLRGVLGVQLQSGALPSSWTPREAIRLFARYHGHAPRLELIDEFGLTANADVPYQSLSVGQQRRLNLALAIAHRPRVLFLDEPTAGLDVASRAALHATIRRLREEGVAILLATHDMAEASELSDRIIILLRGQVVVSGTPREITAAGSALTRITIATAMGVELQEAMPLPGVRKLAKGDGCDVLYTEDVSATLLALIERVQAQGDSITDLRVERPSLEERFIELTQEAS